MTPRFTLIIGLLAAAPGVGLAAGKASQEFAQVVASQPDVEHGAYLFKQCTACHGVDGGGTADGSTPRIAGQHFRVIARQLVDFRYGFRWDFRMESIADRHHLEDAQDIADVATYLNGLEPRGRRGVGNGQNLALGAQLYGAGCQSCHGANGEGNGSKGIPRIGGQHSGYLVRQIYDAVDGRRPPLTRTHKQRFAALEFEQVLALGDYISRIGWKEEQDPP